MTEAGLPVEKVSDECFIAHSFTFAPCPCRCGNFKLVGFDASGVARALFSIAPEQVAQMAMMSLVRESESIVSIKEETKH